MYHISFCLIFFYQFFSTFEYNKIHGILDFDEVKITTDTPTITKMLTQTINNNIPIVAGFRRIRQLFLFKCRWHLDESHLKHIYLFDESSVTSVRSGGTLSMDDESKICKPKSLLSITRI